MKLIFSVASRTERNLMNCAARRLWFSALAGACLLGGASAKAQVEEVDPTMGGQGFMLEPTRPTVSLPNYPLRFYPIRKDQLDDRIQSFPLSTISHRLGELFLVMPYDGAGEAAAAKRPAVYDQEVTQPYYYSTRFDESLIRTEFAPGERAGYFRFTFPGGQAGVMLGNRHDGGLQLVGSNAVSGVEKFSGMQAFVYGEFSTAVELQSSEGKKRLFLLGKAGEKSVALRYGISYISLEQAQRNLQAEIRDWNFEAIKERAYERWNRVLGQVKITGGSPEQRRVFYTSLYRCYERMVNISEEGRYYSAFDHAVHSDARPFYVDNWLWDTYRALEPLQTLLNPKMEADKLQSYVRMYQQLGWMPCFAVLWGNHECMTGNHAAPWVADAWAKGVTNFDLKTAYEGLRKNSLEGTWLPWRKGPKCSLDDFLAEHGYMPALRPGEKETEPRVHGSERRQAVSVTQAQSYDDWCTAQVARELGKPTDVELFLKRATNYHNVFRVEKGCVWPKDASGNWIEPFESGWSGGMGGRDYTTENNAFTYDWDVQHDFQGLFELMGGHAKAEAKLDRLFRESLGRSKYEFWSKFPDASGLVGQFSMGNEPSLHIPYIYNYLGAPWKTQKRVRMLLETWFTDTLLGMPGDEDGGGMSAFVVFSMMGFYPVTPGVPIYNLGSPVFDQVTIQLQNGKSLRIVCRNNSRSNKYIQSVRLNGWPLRQVWFKHSDVADGGLVELQMGDTPNRELGADVASLPPSSLKFVRAD
jgi:predicted alpha-1,2-mannosidase